MLIIGLIAGVLLTISATAFAESTSKISAYLRDGFTFKVQGKAAELKTTPIVYKDTTYLPVRELAGMLGYEVGFADNTITLDKKVEGVTDLNVPTETTSTEWLSLRALSANYGFKVSLPSTQDKKLIISYQKKEMSFQFPKSYDEDTTIENENGNQLLVKKDSSLYLNKADVDVLLGQ